jgi:hypothetical protein
MEFGIALVPAADSWTTVQRVEALGFSHAWLYDTQRLCADVFVAMALAAANTRRITIGPGALVPSNRIAPVSRRALVERRETVRRFKTAPRALSTRAWRKTRFAKRVRPLRRLPALSWLPGQRPAHEAACPAVGKRPFRERSPHTPGTKPTATPQATEARSTA